MSIAETRHSRKPPRHTTAVKGHSRGSDSSQKGSKRNRVASSRNEHAVEVSGEESISNDEDDRCGTPLRLYAVSSSGEDEGTACLFLLFTIYLQWCSQVPNFWVSSGILEVLRTCHICGWKLSSGILEVWGRVMGITGIAPYQQFHIKPHEVVHWVAREADGRYFKVLPMMFVPFSSKVFTEQGLFFYAYWNIIYNFILILASVLTEPFKSEM